MNAQFELAMDKQTFLSWVQTQLHRHEWVKGRPVMQQGGSWNHGRIAMRFVKLFGNLLDESQWSILGGNLAVDLGDEIRFPDVMVARNQEDGKVLSTDAPVVLVEVLSPSSVTTDINTKPPLYMALQTLEVYIVASQSEAKVWVWQRDSARADRPFPAKPREFNGFDAVVALTTLGIGIPLKDIYRGITPV